MAQKATLKRTLLGCTLILAAVLLVHAETVDQVIISGEPIQLELGVEKFNDYIKTQEKIEAGKKLYQEASELLEASSIKANHRVFIKRQSSITRSFLSDELQKQKGIFPTACRLVTQGFMSFFKPAPTTTPASSSANEGKESHENTRSSTNHHRDPTVAKALDLLRSAGYNYENDDALWTLANIYFHGQYKAKRDLTQAFDLYSTLADRSGNASAQQIVGFMYSTGIGNVVQRDEAKAMIYTTFAARGNNTAAELTLGYKYMLGIGAKKSCEDSVVYYKRAADKAHAMYTSGPPLGRTMPPPKIRLADGEGGAYGAGASGPKDHSPKETNDITDFIQYNRYLAEQNDPDSQLQLGYWYYTGHKGFRTTIPRDFKEAGLFLKKFADRFFDSKDKDDLKDLPANRVENAGNAASLLGRMYWRGEGFEVDEREALKWFEKGASVNNPAALNAIGTMYVRGAAGLPEDLEEAIKRFQKAADLKYPDAQVNMGLIYLNDPKHDPKHLAQAFKYFSEAAQSQNFQAVYHLGEMVYYGFGAAKKCEEAARYFKYVAERGDWEDSLFSDSFEAFEMGDIEYAAIGYLQAAERGFEVGQSNFAWILDKELPTSHYLTSLTSHSRTAIEAISESPLVNLGTPSRLLEMALVYWTRSANLGDVDARVKMGDYYFSGIGTEIDYKKATACYQIAAEVEQSAMAMWNLGWMYENGIGVAKDFHLAKRWYDRSLVTNPGAFLPVSLSLLKLNTRYIWSYLTGGETSSEAGSFWSIGDKVGSMDSSLDSNGKSGSEGGERTWDTDEDNLEEDDLLEALVLLGLGAVVAYLIYIRQFRFANQDQNQNQNQNGQNNQNIEPIEGLPGDPNAPGRFAYYAAGG
ncbi:ERAD-associated protein [Entomortierella beljakovae]|nr:ERAD-associated protein [Entomortierella beljakovae]